LSFGNNQGQLDPNQESTVDDPWPRCLFLLKTTTIEAKNVLVHCCGEESMSDLSTTFLACTSQHQYAFSTPPCRLSLLMVVPSGTNSKWMIPLMSKKQINIVLILDFDIHSIFDLGEFFKLNSMDWQLTSESY
jgi:hypothetical protein